MATRHLTETPEKAKMHRISRALKPDSAQLLQSNHPVTQLQSTLGNHQIARLIQAKRLSPSGELVGIQRKLSVGAANDQYEQEADQVARQVMNTPDAAIADSMQRDISPEEEKDEMLQTKPLAASITPFVQREMAMVGDEDKEEPIQAKSAVSMSDSFEAGDNIENQLSQSKGRGNPLPDPVRSFMEPRFGVDFSQVRVHTGSDSIQMNRDVNAQAFTHGSDIYFGEGRSPANLELTAHELTHVVQQTGDSVTSEQGRISKIRRMCPACAEELKNKDVQRKLSMIQSENKYEQEVNSVGKKAANLFDDNITMNSQRVLQRREIWELSGTDADSCKEQIAEDTARCSDHANTACTAGAASAAGASTLVGAGIGGLVTSWLGPGAAGGALIGSGIGLIGGIASGIYGYGHCMEVANARCRELGRQKTRECDQRFSAAGTQTDSGNVITLPEQIIGPEEPENVITLPEQIIEPEESEM